MISVVILGAGNVATHFFKVFNNTKDIRIVQWYNRHLQTIDYYKNIVDVTDDLSLLKEADIYIIAVNDDAIAKFSSQLPFENKFVDHTSGCICVIDVDNKKNIGVYYEFKDGSIEEEIKFIKEHN